MLEKRFYAVPPQLFAANGTTNGVITIAGEACTLFKVKQKVILTANGLPNLELEIKEIDSQDNIQVGPFAQKLDVNNNPNIKSQNTGISARWDISAYTVALNAAVFADEQKRPSIDYAEIVRATYQEEPACAVREILVDDCGNTYNEANPLPTNIVPATQIPFTLGALALPALIEKYLTGISYSSVTSDSIGTEEVLTFYSGTTNVGEINLAQTVDGWVLNLGVPEEDFLILETGAFFVLEDDSGGILLE